MSDQDMLHTLSSVDDQVPDTPPEPETQDSTMAVEAVAVPEEQAGSVQEVLPEQTAEETVMEVQPGEILPVEQDGAYSQAGSSGQDGAAGGEQLAGSPVQENPEEYVQDCPKESVRTDYSYGQGNLEGNTQADYSHGQGSTEGNTQADYSYGQDNPEGNMQADYSHRQDQPGGNAQAGYSYGQGSPEEHTQADYSYGQPYGQDNPQNPPHPHSSQGNAWGNNGFDRAGQQAPPPPGYGNGTPPNYGYGPGSNQRQDYRANQPTGKTNNYMAMASLILGILSVLLCCCGGFGIILGAIGIVLAILSRGREPMETSAKAGLGLSIGGIVLGIIVLAMAFAIAGNSDLRSDLYRRGYGDYGDFEHYFEHNGL